jgi:hypothetical protein
MKRYCLPCNGRRAGLFPLYVELDRCSKELTDPPTQMILMSLFAISLDSEDDVTLTSSHSIMIDQRLRSV